MGNFSTLLFLFDNNDDEDSSQFLSKLLDNECKRLGLVEDKFNEVEFPPELLERIKKLIICKA